MAEQDFGGFASAAACLTVHVAVLTTIVLAFQAGLTRRWPAWAAAVGGAGVLGVWLLTFAAALPGPSLLAWTGLSELARPQAAAVAPTPPVVAGDMPQAPLWARLLVRLPSETSAPAPAAATGHGGVGWWSALGGVYLFGVLVGAGRLAGSLRLTHRLVAAARPLADPVLHADLDRWCRRLGVRRAVRLRESDRLSGPATVGLWRPTLLLPTGWRDWTRPQREAVLTHELAHVAHGDYAVWLLAKAAAVAHWHHPLVHLLVGRLQLAQEVAADARAADLDADRPAGAPDYLHTLAGLVLQLHERPSVGAVPALLSPRGSFLRRIEMLRTPDRPWRPPSPLGKAGLLVATAALAAVLAGLRPTPLPALPNAVAAVLPQSQLPSTPLADLGDTDIDAGRLIPPRTSLALVAHGDGLMILNASNMYAGQAGTSGPVAMLAPVKPADVREALLLLHILPEGDNVRSVALTGMVVSLENALSQDQVADAYRASLKVRSAGQRSPDSLEWIEYQGQRLLRLRDAPADQPNGTFAAWLAGDRTLVVGPALVVYNVIAGAKAHPDSPWRQWYGTARDATLAARTSGRTVLQVLPESDPNPITAAVRQFATQVDTVTARADLSAQPQQVRLDIDTGSAEAATQLAKMLEGVQAAGKSFVEQLPEG